MPKPAPEPLGRIVAFDRYDEPIECTTKVVPGPGVDQLRQMLAGHDAMLIGNNRNRDSPIVIMGIDTWQQRLVRMPPR